MSSQPHDMLGDPVLEAPKNLSLIEEVKSLQDQIRSYMASCKAPTLILTVGLPRSGKSTWAAHTGFPVVSPDEIRKAMHGQRFYGDAEPLVWATTKIMVIALFGSGHTTIILDATNLTQQRRREWEDSRWSCYFKLFPMKADVCRERALNDGRPDLVSVIDRMEPTIEWPESTFGKTVVF